MLQPEIIVELTIFSLYSGFLLAYLCFKEKKRIVDQNPALLISIMFVRRYFRLVLPLLVVVGFSMLMDLWTDTPNDTNSVFNVYTRSCPQYWWSIPTLTANFMGSGDMVSFGISTPVRRELVYPRNARI